VEEIIAVGIELDRDASLQLDRVYAIEFSKKWCVIIAFATA